MIPGAVLVPLAGTSHVFYHGDWESVANAVIDFLGTDDAAGKSRARDSRHASARRPREFAEGLTNHAIATRLKVAPRTAEAHVENIRRRKLDVRYVRRSPPGPPSSDCGGLRSSARWPGPSECGYARTSR